MIRTVNGSARIVWNVRVSRTAHERAQRRNKQRGIAVKKLHFVLFELSIDLSKWTNCHSFRKSDKDYSESP